MFDHCESVEKAELNKKMAGSNFLLVFLIVFLIRKNIKVLSTRLNFKCAVKRVLYIRRINE